MPGQLPRRAAASESRRRFAERAVRRCRAVFRPGGSVIVLVLERAPGRALTPRVLGKDRNEVHACTAGRTGWLRLPQKRASVPSSRRADSHVQFEIVFEALAAQLVARERPWFSMIVRMIRPRSSCSSSGVCAQPRSSSRVAPRAGDAEELLDRAVGLRHLDDLGVRRVSRPIGIDRHLIEVDRDRGQLAFDRVGLRALARRCARACSRCA